MSHRRIGFLSSYPPRQCGIATFTSDLVKNISNASNGKVEPIVLAMTNCERLSYTEPVKYQIRIDSEDDYITAADYLNANDADLVCLQHEFGLFGGKSEAGENIELFLDRLNIPLVTTFHTILPEPSKEQFQIVMRLAYSSSKLVVMSRYGANILRHVYGIPTEKISIIPHGIPELPFTETLPFKQMAGLEDRTTILTFGLLGRNKGIEIMLKAMSTIVKDIPDALYIVLGATHPNVLKKEGESYRLSLEQKVKDLKLQDNITFVNEFVDDVRLHKFLQMSDFYVTPYLSEKQITSGTLAFALGTGRVIISTPYWYAKELLAEGCGRLVPFNDPKAIARTILHLKQNPEKYRAIRNLAYTRGRDMTWPSVGRAYWQLFCDTTLDKKAIGVLSSCNLWREKSFGEQAAAVKNSYVHSRQEAVV